MASDHFQEGKIYTVFELFELIGENWWSFTVAHFMSQELSSPTMDDKVKRFPEGILL